MNVSCKERIEHLLKYYPNTYCGAANLCFNIMFADITNYEDFIPLLYHKSSWVTDAIVELLIYKLDEYENNKISPAFIPSFFHVFKHHENLDVLPYLCNNELGFKCVLYDMFDRSEYDPDLKKQIKIMMKSIDTTKTSLFYEIVWCYHNIRPCNDFLWKFVDLFLEKNYYLSPSIYRLCVKHESIHYSTCFTKHIIRTYQDCADDLNLSTPPPNEELL